MNGLLPYLLVLLSFFLGRVTRTRRSAGYFVEVGLKGLRAYRLRFNYFFDAQEFYLKHTAQPFILFGDILDASEEETVFYNEMAHSGRTVIARDARMEYTSISWGVDDVKFEKTVSGI